MKKILFGCALCALISTSVYGQMPKAPAPLVGVAKVSPAKNVEKRSYSGVTVSPQSVALVPRVAAEILEVGFTEGQIVTNNQMLYRLDDTRYAATVKATAAQIEATKARLVYAVKNHERLTTLYKKNVSSMDEMDAALAERDALKATLMQQEANLITAKDDLAYTRILAPITGKIGLNRFTKGNYLTQASGTLTTIMQLDPIRVRFAISNRDYMTLFQNEANLRKEAVIKLQLANGMAYQLEGKVDFVDNAANRTTDTVQVYALFGNPDYTLLPDSTVTVMLQKRSPADCTAVLPSAVAFDQKGPYVWVVQDDKKAVKRRVVVGNVTDSEQYILDGLKPGETVVVRGNHKVMDGITVQTQEIQ